MKRRSRRRYREPFEPRLNVKPFSLSLRKTQLMSRLNYWRLRVDFHPRLPMQPFYLGSGKDKPTIGGDDVEHICAR